MQINITGKGIELTDAIKDYIEKKFDGLEKFYDRIIRANVTVGMETKHHLKGQVYICECRLEIPGKDVFAEKNEKTLYKAIDKVRDYLEGEVKKHKAKFFRSEQRDKNVRRESKEYQM
ncbi:MAG: ribosomal subunit interface protein [Candidatus Magasanikbacteria bacterium RIFOXYA2_FULL_44_8]|uniref:Ribosomal subunit interface protein n=1 Tax=Candidatus Magasanikbacteria bacterium RIFOXYA2_FULL_44_8 TaxID=1798696 RepID=A0A1F6NLD3_9BACT|nr:MAG: ribosomal subunit interface protein [Candidatus Magasanikbacteria bacterium RIFOXYA2_FULL_44_8]